MGGVFHRNGTNLDGTCKNGFTHSTMILWNDTPVDI